MESLGHDPSVGIAIAVMIRARDVILALVGMALGGAHIWQRVGMAKRHWPATSYEAAAPDVTAPEVAAPAGDSR
jgi:hypothetical protein